MRSLIDLGHPLLEQHVMIYCVNFAASDKWRASPCPLDRVSYFAVPPKRFTASDIMAHMLRGLEHDQAMARAAGVQGIHTAMRALCHGYLDDDLKFDEVTQTFWYVPFAQDLEVR
jgi:hypothetical protein